MLCRSGTNAPKHLIHQNTLPEEPVMGTDMVWNGSRP